MGSMHVEREVALGRAWRPGVEVSDRRVDRRRHFSFRHQFIIPYLLTVHDRSRGVNACCLLLAACNFRLIQVGHCLHIVASIWY